jgi:hypothetical protein
MNLINRMIVSELNPKLNINGTVKGCECEECTTSKVENTTVEYSTLSEEEIEQIIKKRYLDKDEKTKKFIRNALRKHGDRYDYSLSKYINCDTKLWIICKKHDKFEQTPYCHVNNGYGCYDCGKDKLSELFRYDRLELINKLNNIYNFKYDYSLMKYNSLKDDVIVICPKHGKFEVNLERHLRNGVECRQCKLNNNFLKKLKELYGNLYYVDESTLKEVNCEIDVLCTKHNYKFVVTPIDLMYHNKKCKFCKVDDKLKNIDKKSMNVVRDTETFIYASNIIHDNFYIYKSVKYIKSTSDVIIICPKHGEFKITPNNHLSGEGCPFCKKSKGEMAIFKWLINHNYLKDDIFPQYRFNDCKNIKPLPFDFYVKSKNICVEFNGEQHYKSIPFWGGEEQLGYRQSMDEIKRNYCKTNNIKLIIINKISQIDDILSKNF